MERGRRGRKLGKEESKEKGEEKGEEGGEGGGGGKTRGREEWRRGEYIASTVVHGPCLGKYRWDMLATYSEQPCNVRCMSSIHTPSRAWDTLTRLGGLS